MSKLKCPDCGSQHIKKVPENKKYVQAFKWYHCVECQYVWPKVIYKNWPYNLLSTLHFFNRKDVIK